MTSPRISVVTPAYNAERFVEKTVRSILGQSFQDFEYIIVNDGSKDSTLDILKRLQKEDSRIKIIDQQNSGQSGAINNGISHASAALIARIDADDIALPDRFEKQLQFLDAHPDHAGVGSAIRMIDAEDNVLEDVIHPQNYEDIAKVIETTNPFAHSAMLLRKECILAVGSYRAAFNHSEDYDLWLRLMEKYKLANLAEPLVLYRQHNENMSFLNSQNQTLRGIVAILSSKARKSGLKDPMNNTDKISNDTLSLFNLSDKEKADYFFKTYQYSLWFYAENRDDQSLKVLLQDMKEKHSSNSYYTALASIVWMELCRLYFLRQEFMKSYIYLFKLLPYQPGKALYEAAYNTKKIASFYYEFWYAKLYHFAKKLLK